MRYKEDIGVIIGEIVSHVRVSQRIDSLREAIETNDDDKEEVVKKVYRKRGHAISFDEDGNPTYDRRLKNFRNVFPKQIEEQLKAIKIVEELTKYDLTDREAVIVTEILSLSEDFNTLNELASDATFLGVEGMMQHIFACIE